MTGSGNLWNAEQLLTEMEKMQDQIDSLMGEKDGWKQEALQGQQTISELSSQISLLKSKLQKSAEKIGRLNEADLVLKENEQLKKQNRELIRQEEEARKEALLGKEIEEAKARNAAAIQKEMQLEHIIREEVKRKVAIRQKQYEREKNNIRKSAEMKFQQKRAAYALLFTLSCVYGILVTLFSAIRSPVVCRDASQFLIRIRNVGMTVVSGIDNIAAFFSSFLALISYPEARVVFSGLVYLLVTIIIYGVMIAVVFYAIRTERRISG